MKSLFLKSTVILSIMAFTLTVVGFSLQAQEPPETPKAKAIYCQLLGDRKGCVEHSWRTCAYDVFCDDHSPELL